MKKIFTTAFVAMLPMLMLSQGWPNKYKGVMLQGFYWDSFNDTRWPKLESQADELAEFFNLVWVPQSGNCGGTSMGYDDLYWFTNYSSSFGNVTQLRSMINTFNQPPQEQQRLVRLPHRGLQGRDLFNVIYRRLLQRR